jgi:hypothetical protein
VREGFRAILPSYSYIAAFSTQEPHLFTIAASSRRQKTMLLHSPDSVLHGPFWTDSAQHSMENVKAGTAKVNVEISESQDGRDAVHPIEITRPIDCYDPCESRKTIQYQSRQITLQNLGSAIVNRKRRNIKTLCSGIQNDVVLDCVTSILPRSPGSKLKREVLIVDNEAVVRIQAWWRRTVVNLNYTKLRLTINLLPRKTRQSMLCKVPGPNLWGGSISGVIPNPPKCHVGSSRTRFHSAARLVQSWWRMCVAKQNYSKLSLTLALLPPRTRDSMITKLSGPRLLGSKIKAYRQH